MNAETMLLMDRSTFWWDQRHKCEFSFYNYVTFHMSTSGIAHTFINLHHIFNAIYAGFHFKMHCFNRWFCKLSVFMFSSLLVKTPQQKRNRGQLKETKRLTPEQQQSQMEVPCCCITCSTAETGLTDWMNDLKSPQAPGTTQRTD